MRLSSVLVVNPRAPVRAYLKGDLTQTKNFRNLAEFEAWYSSSHGEDMKGRVNSQYLFTDVLVDHLGDRTAAPRAPRAAAVTTRGSAMVTVDGVAHGSVYRAFVALGLPEKVHAKFRAELKKTGELAFTHGGKTYNFRTGVA